MNKKLLSACVAVMFGAGAGYALNAFAQAKPDVLVKQRQSVMVLHGKYWGQLGGMMKGNVPYDQAIVARNAGFLDALSQMPWDGFQPSTKDETNTKALPAIYENPAKFKEAQDRYRGAIGKLVAASKGDEAAFKAAGGEVGKSCGGCHESFRAPLK